MTIQAPTREHLYEQVWSRPMIHVAKDYGLSDRGLAKLCTRHEIPVPPRGYWAKKAHGHNVKQPPLPPPSHPHLDRIEIAPGPPAPVPKQGAESIPEIAFEQQPENRIEVATEVSRFHPFVRRTRAALRQAKPGDRGLLFPAGPCLDVCVSKAQVARALRLMDALVRALDSRGYSPALLEKGRGLFVRVMGQTLSITLIERTVQQPRKAREYEQWALDHGHRRGQPYDLVPSGLLSLRIGDKWWRHDELKDTPHHPLENALNRFIVRLVRVAVREKAAREARERRQREDEAAEARRRVEEEKRRKEEEKERQWDEWMAAWAKSQQIRAFAAAVGAAFDPIDSKSEIAEWLTWAAAYATRQNPLSEAKE
jgi:hypothetical protein